jgi:hypothetical protein
MGVELTCGGESEQSSGIAIECARISMSFSLERTRVPGGKYRDYIVLFVAAVGGLIPETGSLLERTIYVSAIVPPLLAGLIAFYYRAIPLSWKLPVTVILSCGSFLVRWLVTWFAVDFNLIGDSGVLQWPAQRFLFVASLIAPCACLVPSHFIILFTEKILVAKKLKGR